MPNAVVSREIGLFDMNIRKESPIGTKAKYLITKGYKFGSRHNSFILNILELSIDLSVR
jgi:hypothetical protein